MTSHELKETNLVESVVSERDMAGDAANLLI